jgi:4-hydroxybenzoate polyprenyltransferase
MSSKHTAIVLVVMVIAVGIGLSFESYKRIKATELATRAGLEECPIRPGSYKTIWVKDCTKYLKEIEKGD